LTDHNKQNKTNIRASPSTKQMLEGSSNK